MLARRIIAISSDKSFGKQIAVALKAAGGTVNLYATLEELGTAEVQAALVVLHLDGELSAAAATLIPRLTGDTRVIAILPRSNLAAVVDIMQGSERVAAMMVAEAFDPRQLSALATRVVAGDIFGLEKHLLWGAQIHSFLVGDYQEKSLCIAAISEFAESMGVRRKYRESIDQCIDEMLMNALYDAPVDEQGRPLFSEIPTKTRISLRVEQKVVVQYACDGKQFAVAVRDAFGTLERSTVLRYLHKCLHNEQQIDRKAGGAGLGLYLMTNSSTSVMFDVLPGVATEAVCTFDLETPKLQLERFGYFNEKIDAAGRLATGPARRLPAGASHPVERRRQTVASSPPRSLVIVLSAAIVAVLGLVLIAAWPRIFGARKTSVEVHTVPAGATVEVEGRNAGTATDGTLIIKDLEVGRAYPIVARLDGYDPVTAVVQPHAGGNPVTLELSALAAVVMVDSVPTGASVELDGKPAGTTPLTIKSLKPRAAATLILRKPGFQDASAKVTVPEPGKEIQLIQPLSVSDDFARIKLDSDPPGAQVIQNGQVLAGTVTPCEILVEAGKLMRFTLALPHKVPAVIPPFTPEHGADGIMRSGKLVDGVTVRVQTSVDARVRIANAPHCQDVATPVDCVLAPGAYSLELIVAQGPKNTRSLTVKDKTIVLDLKFGIVEAGPGRLIQIAPGNGVRKATVEAGSRRVVVLGGEDGAHGVTVNVKAGGTVTVN